MSWGKSVPQIRGSLSIPLTVKNFVENLTLWSLKHVNALISGVCSDEHVHTPTIDPRQPLKPLKSVQNPGSMSAAYNLLPNTLSLTELAESGVKDPGNCHACVKKFNGLNQKWKPQIKDMV